MPQPYKIEVFDRGMDFRSAGVLDKPDISFDYLTLERTTVTLKAIDAQRGTLRTFLPSRGKWFIKALFPTFGQTERQPL